MKHLTVLFLCLLLSSQLLSCGGETAADAPAIDAAQVTFEPTVYYARDGRIRFLYDDSVDMLSAMEGYDMASLYSGSVYSMVFSYVEGTVSRKDADAAVQAEFNAGDVMTVSEKTTAAEVSGHPFRRAEITASDGSVGAVLYGSTNTGFAEIYYILAPDADDAARAHVEEILSTVTLAEFETTDDDKDVKIYFQ